jgi:glycosyltransferase involved in cell wall biosynthesis
MRKRLSLSIIIPTKDREKLLLKSLNYLNKNFFLFNEVIIVDSSSKKIDERILKTSYKKMNIKYLTSQPSTSIQRNLGLKNVKKKNKLIMFLDDDIKFNNDAFKKMYSFINNMSDNIVGVGFNSIAPVRYKKKLLERIKNSSFFSRLGLYHSRPGVVTTSGWQTKILNIKKDIKVEWLPTQACIYKKNKIRSLKFSNQLGAYAYLEDLLFSHQISKRGYLVVHCEAKYKDTLTVERNHFWFGIKEVRNRIVFIKQNKLPIKTFVLGYIFFISKNFLEIFLNLKKIMRFFGNIVGIFYLFKIK